MTDEQLLLNIWELGTVQHPLDQALTILKLAFPEQSRQELANLSIGQRDAHLLSIREQFFGSQLNGYVECPKCSERLEFSLSTQEIRTETLSDSSELSRRIDELVFNFRLPNSLDLVTVANCDDLQKARLSLVKNCLIAAKQGEKVLSFEELSEVKIEKFATILAESDPQAEILLNFNCPNCGHEWQEILEIISFFWQEISVKVKRILQDVHTLALAYGWSESDILALSPTRRQLYLEMVM